LTGSAKFFAIVFLAGSAMACAQVQNGRNFVQAVPLAPGQDNFVAQVRLNKSWEHGPFVNYGNGVGLRSQYRFLWAGYQLGKPLTPVLHAGILSGQFELGGSIMPLWQAYTPAPHYAEYICNGSPCSLLVGGGTFRGVSIMPVIFRWNFESRSRRFLPWAQAAGGLIYTTHEFPPNYMSNPATGLDGSTCVWNFSPQGGFGFHYFTRAKRSIDLGVNAVHISSASIGDHNPGVNASVQFQLGYTFWK